MHSLFSAIARALILLVGLGSGSVRESHSTHRKLAPILRPRALAPVLLASTLIVTAQGASAQETAWTQLDLAMAPPPRLASDGLAYDSGSDRMVLFGGLTNERTVLGDTWTFDLNGGVWEDQTPSVAPPARSDPGLAYDVQSDRMVLFGGVTNVDGPFVDLNDTWAYDVDSNTWQNLEPASAPGIRHGHQTVYDLGSDRVIMVGGHTGRGPTAVLFGDTWAYDFDTNTWTEVAPIPGQGTANFHGFAYDAESDRAVMYGGDGSTSTDTWAYDYDTDTWTNMNPAASPPGLSGYAMAYDTESDRVVLFGGTPPQTWAYDLNENAWRELNPSVAPSGRQFHVMAYHAPSDRIVLFGGCLSFETNCDDETWSFDHNALFPPPSLDFLLLGVVVAVAAAAVVADLLIWRSRRLREQG